MILFLRNNILLDWGGMTIVMGDSIHANFRTVSYQGTFHSIELLVSALTMWSMATERNESGQSLMYETRESECISRRTYLVQGHSATHVLSFWGAVK